MAEIAVVYFSMKGETIAPRHEDREFGKRTHCSGGRVYPGSNRR